MFICFISINDSKSSPTVRSRSIQTAYLLRYECLRFWRHVTRVRRGNREWESTFLEITCTYSPPSRVPDERTDILHPIKILTRWTRGKIIIIVCLVALKINWRFHHLTINPIIEFDEIPTFSFYTIAVLTNSQSSNKARALRSSLELGVFQQSKVGRLLKVVVVQLGMSSVTASKVILLVHQIVHFPCKTLRMERAISKYILQNFNRVWPQFGHYWPTTDKDIEHLSYHGFRLLHFR